MAGISTGHSALRNIGHRPARIAELAEYVATVRRLLAGDRTHFDGDVRARLDWLDSPAAVPLHVAATGPKLTRAAAGMGDGVILLQGAAPDLVDAGLAQVAQGIADAGRAVEQVPVTLWLYVGLDADEERAREQVLARVAAVLRMSDPARFEGRDREDVSRLHRAYDMSAHAHAAPQHAVLVPTRFVDRYAVAGTPEQVRTRIAALRNDPRVARVVVSPRVGAPGDTVTRDFIRAFGEAVLAGLSI